MGDFLTPQQVEEYQNMKMMYQNYKEDSIFYKGEYRKLIINLLRSVPKNILIGILRDLKIVKPETSIVNNKLKKEFVESGN